MKRLILCILLLANYFNTASAQQTIQTPIIKKIEVVGSAEMEVVPDEIYVGFTLQEYYNKQKEKAGIDDISRNFLVVCEKAGISKTRIEVQNMSGFDNSSWWYKRRKKEQPDLLQNTTYVIQFSNPAEVDKLVNQLDDNATQNVFISKISSSKESEYRKQLKIQALQNAKAKADYLLTGIGEKAGGVLFIKEVDFTQPVYPIYEMKMANTMMAGDSNSSANEGLNFKKIKYRFEVEAHFGIQ